MYFHHGGMGQSRYRFSGFARAARDRGVPWQVFSQGPRTAARGRWRLSDQLADLADALRASPKPVGVYTADADHGERVLQACRLAGLDVPGDVAVVCHSPDTHFCELSNPPMSSVAGDPREVGYEAARLLDDLMAGRPVPSRRRLTPPRPVVVRASSDFIAVADPLVDQALRLIRERLADLPGPQELVAMLPTSRPTLERRFRKALGRSPAAELRRARLHACRQLLRETDQTLTEIAISVGYSGIWQLCRQFKADAGITATEYRKQFQF